MEIVELSPCVSLQLKQTESPEVSWHKIFFGVQERLCYKKFLCFPCPRNVSD